MKKTLLFGAPHRVARRRTPCSWPAWKAPPTRPSPGSRWSCGRPSSATAVEVLDADGYLLGSPVNLGYLSGALKHFFDQIYYPCLDATRRRPFGVYLHANNDATGALRALDAIVTGLQWQRGPGPSGRHRRPSSGRPRRGPGARGGPGRRDPLARFASGPVCPLALVCPLAPFPPRVPSAPVHPGGWSVGGQQPVWPCSGG